MISQKRKPAIIAGILFSFGILLGFYFPIFPILLAICIILGLSQFLHFRWEYAALMVVLGILRVGVEKISANNHISKFPTEVLCTVKGEIAQFDEYNRRIRRNRVVIKNLQINGITAAGKLEIWTESHCEIGDIISARGYLGELSAVRNPGQIDYQKLRKNKGIVRSLNMTTLVFDEIQSGKTQRLYGFSKKSRKFLKNQMRKIFPRKSVPIISALTLGEKKAISREQVSEFANTGIIHVMAVSGLHVGFLTTFVWLLLSILRIPVSLRIFITSAVLSLFVVVVWFRPSIVRATVMAMLILLGKGLQRSVDGLNLLGIAALIILGWDPKSLFDLGFQLSFAAVSGIMILSPKILKLFKMDFEIA
ncbi:ComEC/Rec2 family competence protein [bacterium]|nr:ComEC/Rec2 family competence protein [bacterium]